MEQFHVALQIEDFLLKVIGIGIELLPEGHRHSILQLRASHLDGVTILVSLVAECRDESGERADECLVHTDNGQADGGGIDIIGRLSAVDVVVGIAILILTLLVPHDLECAVGNDLIGIHVHRRAGTALHHVDGEVLVELAIDDLAASLGNGTCNLVVDSAQRMIGLHGGELHVSDGDDIVGIVAHLLARDMIVVDGALCLHTVVSLGGHLELAQEVRLHSVFLFFCHSSNYEWLMKCIVYACKVKRFSMNLFTKNIRLFVNNETRQEL